MEFRKTTLLPSNHFSDKKDGLSAQTHALVELGIDMSGRRATVLGLLWLTLTNTKNKIKSIKNK